ncbi:MAG: hypothetical protein KZQ70_10585 [gamma proteobacterium symbiont of Lucinoma myriamae]|nr:hypothetical protein [gamma proteobacterium symbiont of Lucinoma myriamae]
MFQLDRRIYKKLDKRLNSILKSSKYKSTIIGDVNDVIGEYGYETISSYIGMSFSNLTTPKKRENFFNIFNILYTTSVVIRDGYEEWLIMKGVTDLNTDKEFMEIHNFTKSVELLIERNPIIKSFSNNVIVSNPSNDYEYNSIKVS